MLGTCIWNDRRHKFFEFCEDKTKYGMCKNKY